MKIVQRLPVRIELTDYDPDKAPLFVGLSVTPYVYYKEPATGPHAGDVLQTAPPAPARSRRVRRRGSLATGGPHSRGPRRRLMNEGSNGMDFDSSSPLLIPKEALNEHRGP